MSRDRKSSETSASPSVSAIRELIRNTFTPESLRRFCLDRATFRFIFFHFGPKFSFEDMIDAVIEQCLTHGLLSDLSTAIEGINPDQFERFRERLYDGDDEWKDKAAGARIAHGPFLVPFPRNPDFVGRESDLVQLHDLLSHGSSPVGIKPTGLVGLGGIGKTQLAVQYAHAHRDEYSGGTYWINAVNLLLQEFAEVAITLGLTNRETDSEQAAIQAYTHLDEHPESLVIFDNVEDPAELHTPLVAGLIAANLRCRVLFTTRRRSFPRGFESFEVKTLPKSAALQLLLRARPQVLDESHPEWGSARLICASLGWLPLALELAAAYLEEYSEVTLDGYLQRLRTEGKLATVDDTELRPEDLPTRHEAAVAATLQTQWAALSDSDAQILFRAAGQFPEASWIPVARLGLCTGIQVEGEPGRVSSLSRGLKKLHAVSLIEELTGERLRLHPLVQEFSAGLSPSSFRVEMAGHIASTLAEPENLETHVRQRGIDAVLADLRNGLWLCSTGAGGPTLADLTNLERMLDRESHNLRVVDFHLDPAYILQQLHNQAMKIGAAGLQTKLRTALAESTARQLLVRWHVGSDMPELKRTMSGHCSPVVHVFLALGDRRVISISRDGTLKVWDLEMGREECSFGLQESCVTTVILSPTGDRLITASDDSTVVVWDVDRMCEERIFKSSNGPVRTMTQTADGQHLVVYTSEAEVWDIQTGQQASSFQELARKAELPAKEMLHSNKQPESSWLESAHTVVSNEAERCEKCRISIYNDKTSTNADQEGRHLPRILIVDNQAEWNHLLTSLVQELRFEVVTSDVKATQEQSQNYLAIGITSDTKYAFIFLPQHDEVIQDMTTGTCHTLVDRRLSLEEPDWGNVGFRNFHIQVGGRVDAPKLDNSHIHDSTFGDSSLWEETNQARNTPHLTHILPMASLGNMEAIAIGRAVWIWRSDAGEGHCLGLHNAPVTAIAASSDGRWVVAGASDGSLKIWHLQSEQSDWLVQAHESCINAVAITPDRSRAVSVSDDGGRKIWHLQSKQSDWSVQAHESCINAVAITPDRSRAVTASDDGTLKIWNLGTNREEHTLKGHAGPVNGVAITEDGRYVVSASDDGLIKVWDLTGIQAEPEDKNRFTNVTAVFALPDQQHALSVSHNVKLWDVATGQEIDTLSSQHGKVMATAISWGGRRGIYTLEGGLFGGWDLKTGEDQGVLGNLRKEAHAVAVTPNGRYAIFVAEDATLVVWNLFKREEERTIRLRDKKIRTLALNENQHFMTIDEENRLAVWRLRTGKAVRTLRGPDTTRLQSVAVSPDMEYAVSAMSDGTLRIWDLKTGQTEVVLREHGGVTSVALDMDHGHAASVSEDGTLKVWNLEAEQEQCVARFDAPLDCVALLQDGITILVGDRIGSVYCLDYVKP